ncbi:hypothetical protein [Conyzicola sp.]|uniref:hypothetical protein n=1 Tax=Conyzicola sp. TaxID=1969404 RepID=UPI003988BE7F
MTLVGNTPADTSPLGSAAAPFSPPAKNTARVSTARPRTRDGLARPKTGEVRVRIGALGLSSLGIQASGLVSAVGPDAGGFAAGDRVSYRTAMPVGETSPYATGGLSTVVPERELIGFPKDVALEAAAAYLPLGLVARTVVKQLHSVGRGNRVVIEDDETGASAFVAAWVLDLGAEVVEAGDRADVVITADDFAAARRWRYANGLVQIAAADVFAEVRRGIFDEIPVTTYPIADAERARAELVQRVAASPIVLLPAAA